VSRLYQINLTSGALSGSGSLIGDGTLDIRGLALPAPKLPIVYGLTTAGTILTFGPQAPVELLSAPLAISGLNGGDELVALHFRPSDQKLFALSRVGNLYTIDPTPTSPPTSVFAATPVSGASLHGDPNDNAAPFFTALGDGTFAMDFDPAISGQADAAALRIVGASGAQYFRANAANGNTFADSALALPSPGSAPCNTTSGSSPALRLAGASYSKNSTLYVIDSDANASCLYIASPTGGTGTNNSGSLTVVGPIFQGSVPRPGPGVGGAINSSFGGFDIVGGHNGLALTALDVGASGRSTLYRISLGSGTTGRVTSDAGVGLIGPDATPKLIDMTILLSN